MSKRNKIFGYSPAPPPPIFVLWIFILANLNISLGSHSVRRTRYQTIALQHLLHKKKPEDIPDSFEVWGYYSACDKELEKSN
jgi:hypothetical protein